MSRELRELAEEPFNLSPISWLSFDVAIAAGAGIALSFEYVEFSKSRGRDPNVIEQIIVGFSFIFIINVFIKYFVNFLKRNVHQFDIVTRVPKDCS